jgi:uncharacterized membrane protein SpoIIM required for sporulation
MEKIINKIENFGDTLSPDSETQDKIWSLVSSKLRPEKTVRNKFTLIWFMKNSIKYSLIVFVVCFVLAVPTYLVTNLNNSVSSDKATTAIAKNESTSGVNQETSGQIMAAPSESSSIYDASFAFGQVKKNLEDSLTVDNDTAEIVRAKDIDASLVYNVVDIWGRVNDVYNIISENDAYTTSVSTNSTDAHFVIKVPIAKFDAMHQRLRAIASSIELESINSIDKQNEISSVNTSIKTHEDKIAQLKDALAKATTPADKNTIQIQIDNENSLLISNKDNLSSLTKVTDVATVDLELKQDTNATTTDLVSSVQATWNMVKGVFITWVRIVLLAIVILLAISPIAVPVYLLVRNGKNKKTIEANK